MGGFMVHNNGKRIVCLRCNLGSKKGNGPIFLVTFHSKLDCWIYTVDMLQESLFMGLLLDDKCVIHIPKPMPRGIGGRLESFSLKIFHAQIGHYGTYWRPHSHPFNLFIEFIFEKRSTGLLGMK